VIGLKHLETKKYLKDCKTILNIRTDYEYRDPLAGEDDNFLRTQSIVYEQCQSGQFLCVGAARISGEERKRVEGLDILCGRFEVERSFLSLSLFPLLSSIRSFVQAERNRIVPSHEGLGPSSLRPWHPINREK